METVFSSFVSKKQQVITYEYMSLNVLFWILCFYFEEVEVFNKNLPVN